MSDGGKRKSPFEELGQERETQKAVEEGIDVVAEAMKQLLEQPDEMRKDRLQSLISEVRALSDRLDQADDKSEAAARVHAIERVIEIIQHLADKKTDP